MAVVLNPESGQLAFVDDPAGLVAQGWRIPSPEEADKAAKELDASTTGQQALAQGERVVRGATLGAVRGMGTDEEIQTRADVSQREHPALSFAADVAPQVALGALAATGAGAVAEGLGAAAGGAVAGTAALAGESAAGGLVGAGQAAFERGQYLGDDPGLDAENALIFGGINFGLGAAAHALYGGAGKAAAKASELSGVDVVEGAARESVQDVAKTAEAEAAARAPAGLADGAGAEAVGASVAPAEAAAALTPEAARAARIAELSRGFNDATGLPTEGARAVEPRVPGAEAAAQRQAERAAVDDGMDRALNNASRGEAEDIVQQAVGEKLPAPEADSFGRQRRLYQNRDAILEVAGREMQSDLGSVLADVPALVSGEKRASAALQVSDNLASQRLVTDGIAKNAAELAGQLRGEARAYAAASGGKGLQYQVPGTKRLVMDLMFHAQALSEADTSKGMLEAARSFEQALRDTRAELPQLGTLTGQVRTALEDSSVWGKAGDAQRAFNAVIHDQLTPATEALGAGWETKVKGLLGGNDVGRAQQVNAALDALDQLASVRAQYGEAAAGQRMAEQIAKVRRTMGLAEEVQDASTRMGALGGVVGHVPLVGGLAKEWVTGDLANAFRRLSGAVDRGIDRGVDDWIASSRVRGDSGSLLGNIALKTARAVTGSSEDSAITQIARRQGISHGLARFMGSDQTPQAAFLRARAALQDDQRFFAAMGQDYKSLQEQAPETYMMLSGRAAQGRAFLLQRMPPNVSVSMMRPEGYPPARDAIEDWSLLWNAVKDPMRVVSNIRSARLPELQAIQAVYPRLYERTQMRVLQKIAAAQLAGKPLDDALLMRLGILFPDVDGAGSPAFSRKVGQTARDYTAAQQQAAQGSSRAASPRPSLSSSPVGGIAQTGATFGTD